MSEGEEGGGRVGRGWGGGVAFIITTSGGGLAGQAKKLAVNS